MCIVCIVCMQCAWACPPMVKTKAKKTNNQASFGGSILKANMEVEAAIQLAHDLDETGMPCVCIGVGLLGVLLDLPERI